MIRELLDKAAMQMVAKQEAEYRAAIDACGGAAWTPEQIKQRCRMVRIAGQAHETLHIDDVPVLEVHPVRSKLSDSNLLTVTQDYRRLYSPTIGIRDCICADPENCRQPVPNRRCKAGLSLSQSGCFDAK